MDVHMRWGLTTLLALWFGLFLFWAAPKMILILIMLAVSGLAFASGYCISRDLDRS